MYLIAMNRNFTTLNFVYRNIYPNMFEVVNLAMPRQIIGSFFVSLIGRDFKGSYRFKVING